MKHKRNLQRGYTFIQQLLLSVVLVSLAQLAIAANATVAGATSPAALDLSLQELDSKTSVTAHNAIAYSAPTNATNTDNLRIAARSTLFLDIQTTPSNPLAALFPTEKIFSIDAHGYLHLDNIGVFNLAGLNESEATLRLSAEPILADAEIKLVILPLSNIDDSVLRPFGSDLFANTSSQPLGALAVPSSYVLAAGDELQIQLFGSENSTTNVTVSREGMVDISQIGPVLVAGKSLEETKQFLSKQISEKLIGVEAYISIGSLKAINLRVVGEVINPGNYVLGALSNVTELLGAAGGISDIGSYRSIYVKRASKTVAVIDLYDLLLTGGTSDEIRLISGDTLFVPVAKQRVSVRGEILRPAIYELEANTTLGTLLSLAGLTPNASSKRVLIERTDVNGKRLIEADVTRSSGRSELLKDGDRIQIIAVNSNNSQTITVLGDVQQAGEHSWKPGLRVSNLLTKPGLLTQTYDRDIALISGEQLASAKPRIISFSPNSALSKRNSEFDPTLNAGDTLYFFSSATIGQRSQLLNPLVRQLTAVASLDAPARVATIQGGVREPGTYPLTREMRVSTLLTLADGLTESARGQTAELTRMVYDETGNPRIHHLNINLSTLAPGSDSDAILTSYDTITVRTDPRITQQFNVDIAGEVRYPGRYRVSPGEKLSQLLERAGGMTNMAFPRGTVFVRESIKAVEKKEMLLLADQIEVGLKATILERADENLRPGESLDVASDVVSLLRNADPAGRLVFDLPLLLENLADGNKDTTDISLTDGDKIYIPPTTESVAVVGEVNRPTTHLHLSNKNAMQYIALSGGITKKSKSKLVYIVRANGAAIKAKTRWKKVGVEAGDTVVVPLDVEKIRGLTKWSEITGIIANLVNPSAAVVNAAAAWKMAEAAEDRAGTIIIRE